MVADDFENNYIKTYQKFYSSVLKYISYIVHDWDICRDILQDTFLKLYEKGIELDPEGVTTYSYLCVVSRNTAVDYLKKKSYEYKTCKEIQFNEICRDRKFYDDVEDIYIEGEVISTLHDTINHFPEIEKEVLIKNIFHNKSVSEISVARDMSKYMVRKILKKFSYHAVNTLKCYFNEDHG